MAPERGRRPLALLGWLIAAAAAAVAGMWLLTEAARSPEGPRPIAYDRQTCDRCGMLISDPSFAAQLRSEDGRRLYFDDPGGLLLWEARQDVAVEQAWFHHVREDRWIPRDEVAFVQASETPMGYGLGAVERGTEGAMSYAEALEQARAREAARRRGLPGAGPPPDAGAERRAE